MISAAVALHFQDLLHNYVRLNYSAGRPLFELSFAKLHSSSIVVKLGVVAKCEGCCFLADSCVFS